MNVILAPSVPCGRINAIPSKSAAHRILICAAFADREATVRCDVTNKDITATVECLCALGAKISYRKPYFHIRPITVPVDGATLNCNESGSTLRFMLPIIPALGVSASFKMSGRLPERPLSPLYEELVAHGAELSPQGSNPLTVSGALCGEEYRIRGDVSSQFISGLMLALTVSRRGGKIIVEGKTESAPYVDMTAEALAVFGAPPLKTDLGYEIPAGQSLHTPTELDVEGDWSNAAFPLCMGAIGNGEVTVCGLSSASYQGDKAVVDLLRRFGASVKEVDDRVTVIGGHALHGISIDASQIPDLVPVLATVACVAEGTTEICGAARLRLKESDRLLSVSTMLKALGADIAVTEDGLVIHGKKALGGGAVDTFNDHRIAMSAAVASVACTSEVTVRGAECTSKSYPDFWSDIRLGLGISASEQT